MPKPRNPENRGLPLRWKFAHGAYYYNVPKGQEAAWEGKKLFRLGKTTSQAYKVWADKLEYIEKSETIGDLLDRYILQVTPTKAPKSQANDKHYALKLRSVFGPVHLNTLLPQHIYKYVDKRTAKVSAKREIALLSHAFTKAVEWGYINRHPFKGEIRLEGEKTGTRYVEDWEIAECMKLQPHPDHTTGSISAIQAYIRLKLLTGMRRGDILRLQKDNLTDEGISIVTNKTGKAAIYEWTPDLRSAVDQAINARPVLSKYLFCTGQAKPYLNEKTGDSPGWTSMWQRFLKRVKAETTVTNDFTDRDLRAKVASDATSLEHARQMLTHTDSKITNKVYRRKIERVRPAK